MKKSALGLLLSSLIAFSAGGCSSSSTPNESSAEWQKDAFCITVHDQDTSGSKVEHNTSITAGNYCKSLWYKEWCMSGSSRPELTLRVEDYHNRHGIVELRYANCWWVISRDLKLDDVPGSDWSNSFERIELPDMRDSYETDDANPHWGWVPSTSAVWYKEWQWGSSGVRCLTVRYRYKPSQDSTSEMMRETRYIGCRYSIETKVETSSDSTSA